MNLLAKLFLHSFNKNYAKNCQHIFLCKHVDKYVLYIYNNYGIIKTFVFVRTALRRRSIFLHNKEIAVLLYSQILYRFSKFNIFS